MRQSSHVSVETNSNKRISVLGTNHTKIYRVNLVGFKHRAEDPARSPHKQSKYTLRSKRFSNVLTNHQGRFPKPWDRQDSQLNLETVPEATPLTNRGTFHKRLTLMILHTGCQVRVDPNPNPGVRVGVGVEPQPSPWARFGFTPTPETGVGVGVELQP